MTDHKVVFSTPPRSPTAAEAVRAIYGVSARELVLAILENKDGKYDHLYNKTKEN